METVELGSGDHKLVTSKMGMGCMSLTAFYGSALPDEEALEVLKGAYRLGVRHFDTAQAYCAKDSSGQMKYNEELLGKFLKLEEVDASQVTVATKYYPRSDADGKPMWTKELFFQETEKSLQRLGVDCIDLYYFHRIHPKEVVTLEETMEAMKELVDQGKVKRVGLSEASPEAIRRCHKIVPITAIQQEWSLFAYDLEEEIVPLCKELGIGIVSYSPVARGFLTGVLKSSEDVKSDWRATIPYLQEENIQENRKLLEKIQDIANKKGCTLSQLCIAWVMAQVSIWSRLQTGQSSRIFICVLILSFVGRRANTGNDQAEAHRRKRQVL